AVPDRPPQGGDPRRYPAGRPSRLEDIEPARLSRGRAPDARARVERSQGVRPHRAAGSRGPRRAFAHRREGAAHRRARRELPARAPHRPRHRPRRLRLLYHHRRALMMTKRLYHDDSYLRRFDAQVVAVTANGVILDQTAFYPEAGGQLGDRGMLGSLAVRDTQETDAGAIIHLIDGLPPPVGTRVTGELDWARRRQHMAQHTAQHLLSGALLDRAEAPTASARLGESALTIDVARDRIPEGELAAAEDLAN